MHDKIMLGAGMQMCPTRSMGKNNNNNMLQLQ